MVSENAEELVHRAGAEAARLDDPEMWDAVVGLARLLGVEYPKPEPMPETGLVGPVAAVDLCGGEN